MAERRSTAPSPRWRAARSGPHESAGIPGPKAVRAVFRTRLPKRGLDPSAIVLAQTSFAAAPGRDAEVDPSTPRRSRARASRPGRRPRRCGARARRPRSRAPRGASAFARPAIAARVVDEEHAPILVAPPRDAQPLRPAAGRHLPRDEAEPSGEVAGAGRRHRRRPPPQGRWRPARRRRGSPAGAWQPRRSRQGGRAPRSRRRCGGRARTLRRACPRPARACEGPARRAAAPSTRRSRARAHAAPAGG